MQAYEFHDEFILRTPLRPYRNSVGPNEIPDLLQDEQIMEALYLASPVLQPEVQKWLNGSLPTDKTGKLLRSLYKYLMRLCTRCTPFGLFASCTLGKWKQEAAQIDLDPPLKLKRNTRLDNEYLYALTHHLERHHALRPYLKFHPNSSRQIHRQQFRYIEYFYADGMRKHKLSAAYIDPYLNTVLTTAENGASIDEMQAALLSFDDSLSNGEISNYLEAVIENQILTSELEPSLTGPSPLMQLLEYLRPIALTDETVDHLLQPLEAISRQMETLDKQVSNTPEDYLRVAELLTPLGVAHNPTTLFQVDAYRSGTSVSLSAKLQTELSNCLEFLDTLDDAAPSTDLLRFMQVFHRRYGRQSIPLAEALDNSMGIGFPVLTRPAVANPLLESVNFSADTDQSPTLNWSKYEAWIFRILQHYTGARQINLADLPDELKYPATERSASDLGPTLYTWFRLLENDQIYLEGAGGSCAVNLISRFATAHEDLRELTKTLVGFEEQHLGNSTVLAEVVHLPESRTGNILQRPDLRTYEIPYLGRSSKPDQQQLPVDDLLVSVDIAGKEIVLWSKKLNKRVIPRLSNAHNYANSPLPIYRFLCELQQHGEKRSLIFDPGVLRHKMRYYPRIQWKDIILRPATWNLQRVDYRNVTPKSIHQWQEELGLPNRIVLTEGDNELLIDLQEPLACEVLCHKLKKSPRVMIQEFLVPDKSVRDREGQHYTNEILAFLYRSEPTNESRINPPFLPHPSVKQRAFGLGSEWLYYKMYTSPDEADRIITDYLLPAGNHFLEQQWITDWFFIRYNDPDHHLRFRLKLAQPAALPKVIEYLYRHFQPLLQQRIIQKLQTDTYEQEIERYGAACMELSERWFMYDSIATAEMLSCIEGDEGEELRWLYAARAIDVLLDAFGLNPKEKESLLLRMKSDFAREFNLDKNIRSQLAAKYRRYRPLLSRIFDPQVEHSPIQELEPILDRYRQRSAGGIRAIGERTEQPLEELLWSYVHMLCNRIFKSEPRKCEAVLYDFVYQALKTKHILAGKRKQASSLAT
ncbi:MAG: lantibiotic dehydratase [Lewinella sp.]|nr:lantibiotic dehydratase [Lewinella sp.]